MTPRSLFQEFIESRGVLLSDLGIRERALSRTDALIAVDLAAAAGLLVLGGDVYVRREGHVEPEFANWHVTQRGESRGEFVSRCQQESRAYIAAYPDRVVGEILFVVVTDDGERIASG